MLSHLIKDPSPDTVAAKKETTAHILELLLSGATQLQHLRLSCKNLQQLPAAHHLGQLSHLRSLTISECSMLQELPASIGNLSSLTSLTISSCEELMGLPDTLGDLGVLPELSIYGCMLLQELPASIAGLEVLQTLTLTATPTWLAWMRMPLQAWERCASSASACAPLCARCRARWCRQQT
jgi:Leucine-rich repeat (LRR) protein